MEQYFEIPNTSNHYKEYFDWFEKDEKNKMHVKNFFKRFDITTNRYAIYDGKLWIEDCKENRNKFGKQLAVKGKNGVVPFKKTSKIGKAWSALNIQEARKPFVGFFFPQCIGRIRSRLFHVKNKVFCSIECVDYDVQVKNAEFIEMKASEFFKIVEGEE